MDQSEVPEVSDSSTRSSAVSPRIVVLFVVIAVFAGLVAAKVMAPTLKSGVGPEATAASLTSVRNDASADYVAAAKTGKPIYVLFHSLS
jgi:hypothetical protein